MGAKRNLINQTFGKLTVISELPKEERPNPKKVYWRCLCECGNLTLVQASNLTNGHTTSCGCKRAEVMSLNMSSNLINKKFGKLLVVEKTDIRYGDGCIVWKCQCECGNIAYVNTNSLKREDIISCGCVRSKGERLINQLLFENNINFKVQYRFKELKDKGYLYFDFAILDEEDKVKCLIEYQGVQHYDPGALHGVWKNTPQAHDNLKRDFCEQNHIPLIEIPYTDYDKITWEYLENKLNL